jgi:hypothetical protein
VVIQPGLAIIVCDCTGGKQGLFVGTKVTRLLDVVNAVAVVIEGEGNCTPASTLPIEIPAPTVIAIIYHYLLYNSIFIVNINIDVTFGF